MEPGIPPRWQQGRCQVPWGQQGGPAPQQFCLGLNFVHVLKTNVFSEIASLPESCSARPNVGEFKEKYF